MKQEKKLVVVRGGVIVCVGWWGGGCLEWRVHNLMYGKIDYGGDARSSIVLRKGGIYCVHGGT